MTKRAAALLLWLLALATCAGITALHLPLVTDLTAFMPRTDSTTRLLSALQAGPTARLVLLGLEGGTPEQRIAASRALAERLRATGLFSRVVNGPATLTPADQEILLRYRYLLSPAVTPERFSAAALRTALSERLRELGAPDSPWRKQLLPQDPTAELLTLLSTWQAPAELPTRQGVWISPDGKRALLLAETHAAGFDVAAQAQALAAVREHFAAVRPAPSLRLLLGGTAAFAVSAQATIRAETTWLSIAASIGVALLLWSVLRSPGLVVLGTVPLISAMLAAMAAAALIFGQIYAITLAFGVTLLGVAIDYPIHFFSHLRTGESPGRSLARIWPTLRLSAATTACGYLAMLTAPAPGLAQLGVFAIVGLLTAAACTRWLLPVLLPPTWTPRTLAAGGWLRSWLTPGRGWAGLSMVGGLVALGLLLTPAVPAWEDDLAALSPLPAKLLAQDRELCADLGAPEVGHVIVITAPDPEHALQRSETAAKQLAELVAAGALSGYDLAARYLPSRQTQRQRQAALPESAQLQRALREALIGLPFRPATFEPFLAAVAASRTLAALRLSDLAATPLGTRVSALLFPWEEGWLALLTLRGVRDPAALAQTFRDIPHTRYLAMKTETERLMTEFRVTALERLGIGIGIIALLLWLGLGRGRRVIAALLPALLAVAVTVALLTGLGERLALFHLATLLLVLGVGLDYSLFFSRPDRAEALRRRTLFAVLICSGSTLTVFGMLAVSTLPALHAIGLTAALGVFASFFMALTLARRLAG